MNRTALLISAAALAFTIGCSTAPSSTSPSAASIVPQLFGVSLVDFARCLSGSSEAACFASARLSSTALGAAATAPGAPSSLSTSSSGGTVTLTWSAPSSGDPVTSYTIEAGSGPGLANLAVVTTNSTATAFSAAGVGNGTYYVRVRAQNASGTSAASNESTLIVGSAACTSAPNAPAGFAIAVSGSTLTLTWSAPAAGCAPSSYLLQAGSAAGGSDLANANVGGTTTYVATGVGAGTYYVRVRAINAFGTSSSSNEVTAIVAGGTPTPTSVTRWVGLSPDGMVDPVNRSGQCPLEYDLQMDLTANGTAVTGTAITYLRRVAFSSCSDVLGETARWSVNGTIAGSTITFSFGSTGAMRFTGAVTGTRMTGTFLIFHTGQTGTFAANRQ